jgi:thioredoxin-like negative regulator of GroEL
MTEDGQRLTEAGALLAAGRYDQALKLLSGSQAPERHALLGRAYLGRRHGGPAREQLRLALAHDPADAQSLLGLARAHLTLLDPGTAIALLERLKHRAADLSGLGETLVSAYRRDARYEDALALADDLPSLSPSLLYERALTLLNLGRAEDSLEGFDRLLAEDPEHAAGWFWSHAPALDLQGWAEAERRLLAAAACQGANRKYQGFIAAYDVLRGAAVPRPCPVPYRHLTDAAQALLPKSKGSPHLIGVHAAMLRWSLTQAKTPGLLAEFGVRRGTSIRVLAGETEQTFHGFDSFVGLPEAWVKAEAGVLTTGGELPAVPANVTLHAGWFEDSLPPFLAAHSGPLRFANIDCDIYSSTRTVLRALADRIRPGTILLFDELVGNRSWRQDEYKALTEFAAEFGVAWEVLAINLPNKQVCVRIV